MRPCSESSTPTRLVSRSTIRKRANYGWILIHDKEAGFTQRTRKSDPGLSLDRSAAGVTFQRGVPAVFRRSELDALGWHGTSLMRATGVESICCVPLVTSNGKLGTLLVGSAKPDEFSESDVTLLGHSSAQIAIAIENARAYQRVVKLNAQLIDEKQYLEGELQNEFADIVAISPALRRILKAVETVAPTDTTVLILGETGTGKELIARSIHNLSPRRAHTFVRTSVVALPSSLLESELFGHEKGAFTGATASRAGRLELANRGTLFLDEVGDIPGEMQPKLLRVLQEREFERLGSTRTQHVDVRIVAATNRDLEHMVEEGSFRSDLYYRLNVFPITIPPLRDRLEDLAGLARHFAAQCARRTGRPVPVDFGSGDGCAQILELARKYSRTAECDRAGGDPDDRSGARPAAAGSSVANQAACGSPEKRGDIQGCRTRHESFAH